LSQNLESAIGVCRVYHMHLHLFLAIRIVAHLWWIVLPTLNKRDVWELN